ncbi:MAG: histidine phosphatase family protein [Pseudomonadota bacterium]
MSERPARLIAALIRHGDYHQLPDTPSAHQPFGLTPEGEKQARDAAAHLRRAIRDKGWSLAPSLDCSRLLRAWQTASLIAGELEFPEPPRLEEFDALAERGVGSSAANLTRGQIEAVLRADPRFADPPAGWKSDSHYRLPLQGAESLLEAGERVAAHLAERMEALRETAGRDTLKLFVGHGAAFRHAAYHLGVLDFGQVARLSMYHARPVYLEYLPIEGVWHHLGGEWKLRAGGDEPVD